MACMKDAFVERVMLDGRFETLSPLNHGSFGMVFLAKDVSTNQQVAIKCLTKPSPAAPLSEVTGNDHLVELACHARLGHHANIVNLIHHFESEAHMFLVLEYCAQGDLYEAIRTGCGPLETEHVRSFMLQLIAAVEFMHGKGIYHRDIKPENIFLTHDGSMKLGDFGLSTTETMTTEASVGSDRYMAPEQHEPPPEGYSPAQADIWAVGICLLNILFSRNPFVTPSAGDVIFSDFVRDRQSLFDVFPAMSQDTFDVLEHALAIDPAKRSLSAMKDALRNVLSFTTNDDIFDEFCMENKEPVAASANRLPLRTPSIQSPQVDQTGAFPWSKHLHRPSSPRQLSAIADTESADGRQIDTQQAAPWYSNQQDVDSVASILDSALGASVKSMQLKEPKPRTLAHRLSEAPVSGSLPMAASKVKSAMSSVFGKKEQVVSKSWSDIWDEDEEEEQEDARRQFNARNWSSESIDDDPTIRPIMTDAQSLSIDAMAAADVVPGMDSGSSLETLGSFENLPESQYKLPSYSPPFKRTGFGNWDKWSVLGNRRRAATHEKEEHVDPLPKPVTSTNLWRRGFGIKGFSTYGSKRGSGNNDQAKGSVYKNVAASKSGFVGRSGVWERKEVNSFGQSNKDIPNGFGGRVGIGASVGSGGGGMTGSNARSGGAVVQDHDAVKVPDWRKSAGPYHASQGRWNRSTRSVRAGGVDDDEDVEWIGGWDGLHV